MNTFNGMLSSVTGRNLDGELASPFLWIRIVLCAGAGGPEPEF